MRPGRRRVKGSGGVGRTQCSFSPSSLCVLYITRRAFTICRPGACPRNRRDRTRMGLGNRNSNPCKKKNEKHARSMVAWTATIEKQGKRRRRGKTIAALCTVDVGGVRGTNPGTPPTLFPSPSLPNKQHTEGTRRESGREGAGKPFYLPRG